MRVWGAFLAAWLAVAALAPAWAASAADAVLAKSSAALAQGQYQDAETLAASGLAAPDAPALTRSRLFVLRGLARQARGAADEALADFTEGLSSAALPTAERARALFDRGVALDSLGRLDDALGDYSAALRLLPGAPYALNNRANVYRRQGRLEDAGRDYAAALNAGTPNPQYPYYGMGQIAEAEGDAAAARTYYAKAVASAPGYALAADRLKALGPADLAPNGASGFAPAEAAAIVLRPPLSATPITLHPPATQGSATPAATDQAEPVVLHPPRPAVAPSPHKASRPAPRPSGTALRRAIVEGQGGGHIGAALVQLGAWRSEREAQNGWTMAQEGAGGLLDGLNPVIVTAGLPGRGIFYRLRVEARGPVSQFCAALMEKGLACIPARD